MTRSEAITFAISTGKPIRHKYFSKGEFVHYVGNKLFDKDGNELPISEFWSIRSGGYWENDWEDYDESYRNANVERLLQKKCVEAIY